VLIVAPWSGFWDQNFFAQWPGVASWLSSNFVRGGVTGIGVITAVAGLAELGGAFGLGRSRSDVEGPAASS
jgi:hypothetical protein